MPLPQAILAKLNSSGPRCAWTFPPLAALGASRGSLTGRHVKVILAYEHSRFLDHRGSRPFKLILEKQQGQWDHGGNGGGRLTSSATEIGNVEVAQAAHMG